MFLKKSNSQPPQKYVLMFFIKKKESDLLWEKRTFFMFKKKSKTKLTFFVKNLSLVSPISEQDFNVKNVCNMGKIRVFVIYKRKKKTFFREKPRVDF